MSSSSGSKPLASAGAGASPFSAGRGESVATVGVATAGVSMAALLRVLEGSGSGVFPAFSGEGEGALDELDRLTDLASRGHSPSARALVNAGDLLTTLALAAPPVAPPTSLRDRILRAGNHRVSHDSEESRAVPKPSFRPYEAPLETVSGIHETLPEDQERRRLIEKLGAAGGPGEEKVDRALRSVLDRLAAFMDFEVLMVSAVRGADTVHRIHRGFPAELGNVDVVPRAVSFCTHCVSGDAPLVVHDASCEPFFRQGTMVTKMGAKAYLGLPIRVAGEVEGAPIAIGALCCIGTRPRLIEDAEVAFLALFAGEVEAIVTKNDSASPLVDTSPSARPVYKETWFKKILDAELDRFHSAGKRVGSPTRSGAILVCFPNGVGDISEKDWAPFEAAYGSFGTRMVGEISANAGAPTKALLLAGAPTLPETMLPLPSDASQALDALRAGLPGVRVGRADTTVRSADEWIAAAS